MPIPIEQLARRIAEKRGGQGVRATAVEVGISPATLSRVENGRLPDIETFGKICSWLGVDPATYLGIQPLRAQVQVHFKKGATMELDSAVALQRLIFAAQKALDDDEL